MEQAPAIQQQQHSLSSFQVNIAPSSSILHTTTTHLLATTMSSSLSRDAKERKTRATHEGAVLDTTKDIFREFNNGYTHEGKFVEMDKRRPCSYNTKEKSDWDYVNRNIIAKESTITIREPIPRQKSPNGSADITPMPVELRGIPLHQLRSIKANVKRRCEKEGWTDREGNLLTPEKVTMRDVNTYITIPYTKESESSFVETLPSTAGTQPPRFFVIHFGGERFFHIMDCIEQMSKDFKLNRNDDDDKKGGGMTQHTPIWIWAFANNQHDLEDAITADPSESGFAKAMEVANYRTLSILDKDGEVFTRVWYILELGLTLTKVQEKREMGGDDVDVEWNGVWAMYTAHEHTYDGGVRVEEHRKAVGIVAGGAPCDGMNASLTARRERPFPRDRILKGLGATIQTANASKAHDKTHILNYVSGNVNDLDAEPPKDHDNYEALNDAVRGAFASTIAVLQSACDGGDDEWQRMLIAMSKSIKQDIMHFDFDVGDGWDGLSAERAVEMVSHLPPSIEGLKIVAAPYGSPFMDAMIDWIEKKSTNLKSLQIWNTCVCGRYLDEGRDVGIRLAKTLAANSTIESLKLIETDLMGSRNVDEWSKAFDKMTSLKKLVCRGMGPLIEYVDESTLDEMNSTVRHPYDKRQRIYLNDKTFPDATMKEEVIKKLNEVTHATDVYIDGMVKAEWCGYEKGLLALIIGCSLFYA